MAKWSARGAAALAARAPWPAAARAFLELGEESGLIEQVDWLIYEQVIAGLAEGGHSYVSVNVSPRHFRSAEFSGRLFGLLDACGADPRRLRLEITEVALLDDGPHTLRILQACASAASRYSWTISAPASRRCPTCTVSRSAR
jgi:EAL domain-containing protein (putative c-di-GMP-specific phosphodiesterase class I)